MTNYDQVILDYTKAIELNPRHFKAYYNRGNAYLHISIIIRRFDPEPPPKTQPDVLVTLAINGAGSCIPRFGDIILIVAVECIS